MKNNRNEQSTNNQGDKTMEESKNNIEEPRMDGAKPIRDNAALFCAIGLAGGGLLAWAIISTKMPVPKATTPLDVMAFRDWLYAQPFWLRTAIRAGLLTWVALLLHFGAALFSQLIVSRRKKWATSIKANAVCRLGYMAVQAIALALGLWLCPTIFSPMTTRKVVVIFGTILATMAIVAILLRRSIAAPSERTSTRRPNMNKTKNAIILFAAMAATTFIANAGTDGPVPKDSPPSATGNEATQSASATAGVPPAWIVASTEVVKRAEDGDADAMVGIAKGYMELAMSPRIEANDKEREAMRKEAMGWLRRRAKIMADREGDVESVRKRAEAGDAAAQRNLGFRYSQGVDVEKDEKKAFEWTKKAAEQGDAKAQFNLANDYASGSGTEKTPSKRSNGFARRRMVILRWRREANRLI